MRYTHFLKYMQMIFGAMALPYLCLKAVSIAFCLLYIILLKMLEEQNNVIIALLNLMIASRGCIPGLQCTYEQGLPNKMSYMYIQWPIISMHTF